LGISSPKNLIVGFELKIPGVGISGESYLTVGSNNLSTTFAGVIQDGQNGTGGSLTKIGSGTLDLTGTNIYTGNTTVNGGIPM